MKVWDVNNIRMQQVVLEIEPKSIYIYMYYVIDGFFELTRIEGFYVKDSIWRS